jgi:SAM-dependent methyltransferase
VALSRHYAKVCDLPDFADPELAAAIPEVGPEFGADRPHRKGWEFAMGALFLRDTGHLEGDADILDVGAGADPILFWLANRARRVVATDIYGRGDFAGREADASMLASPASHARVPYPEERLEVHDMDARALEFADESFDAVISFSSIEHFGGPADVARAAREIGRVLRPGGHAFIATELFLTHHPIDRAPVLAAIRAATLGRRCGNSTLRRRGIADVFTARELHTRIVRPSGLELMQPLSTDVHDDSLANPITIENGAVRSATGQPFPHLVVRVHLSLFTSVCLPLVKPRPAGAGGAWAEASSAVDGQ